MPTTAAAPAGVGALLTAYASGEATPSAVVHAAAAAARAGSPANAWLAVHDVAALDAQLAALAGRADLPLYGVPFAVKDNIDVEGLATTAACPAFAYVAERNAECVQRLVEAGAVVVGKVNLDQFATGLVGTRSPYGTVGCLFDERYVGGGSSSGSAAVVACGVVPFALGTDTAGSGRVPAGFQNIVGLKPTPGRVGTRGVVPACRSLDCVSVFALSAADAGRVLAVMEGREGEGGEYGLHRKAELGPAEFGKLRVGVPESLVAGASSEYRVAFAATVVSMAAGMGAEVLNVDFGVLHEVADLLYGGPWVAERHVVLAEMLERQPEALNPVVRGIVEGAGRFSASDAFRGRYRLAELAKKAANVWEGVDLLVVPTTPMHPTIAQVEEEPVRWNSLLGSYTNFVNLLGWSALALPASLVPGEGGGGERPFGVTLIAPGGYDTALVALGATWQASVGRQLPFGAPSAGLRRVAVELPEAGYVPASEPVLRLAAVGAHLTGMPLHYQMQERRAKLLETTTTVPAYRLYALKGTTPAKPGLVRVGDGGCAIEVQVYAMPQAAVGSLLALIPSPLGLGTVELADGRKVHSFICEPYGIEGATDVSEIGGWRAYIQSLGKR